jgi:hypothetical protein
MRQKLDLGALYARVLKQMRRADRRNAVVPGKTEDRAWPEANPFALDQSLDADPDGLLRQLSDANPP